jgi:hypothetical protein
MTRHRAKAKILDDSDTDTQPGPVDLLAMIRAVAARKRIETALAQNPELAAQIGAGIAALGLHEMCGRRDCLRARACARPNADCAAQVRNMLIDHLPRLTRALDAYEARRANPLPSGEDACRAGG